MKISRTQDGSIEDCNGRVLFFSIERFVRDIVFGECCFLCGTEVGTKIFNGEHVIPNWLLKRYSLHRRKIVLPNKTSIVYGKYIIQCCRECNAFLGEELEYEISKITSQGYEAVTKYVEENGPQKFFVWLSLIFIKTHLKDTELSNERDERTSDGKSIAEVAYRFEELHHIHCLARALYTKAAIEPEVFGSFVLFPAGVADNVFESFDFGDNYTSRSIFVRIADIVFMANLNDSNAAVSRINDEYLSKVTSPLSPLQIREVFAHFCYNNLVLGDRPIFSSEIREGKYTIVARRPKSLFFVDDRNVLGNLIFEYCGALIQEGEVKEQLKLNRYTFWFDRHGKFIEFKNGTRD